MGVIDEHWCSKCGKSLDKKKDRYAEVDFINPDKTKKGKPKKTKSKTQHNRAFICEECLNSDPEIKAKFGELRMRGNPNFICTIECKHHAKCKTYEYRNKNVRCKHIAVIGDKVYCKRRHPGAIKLFQEKSKVLEERAKLMQEITKEILGTIETTPAMKSIMEKMLTPGGMKDMDALLNTPPVCPEVVIEKTDAKVEKRLRGEKIGEN